MLTKPDSILQVAGDTAVAQGVRIGPRVDVVARNGDDRWRYGLALTAIVIAVGLELAGVVRADEPAGSGRDVADAAAVERAFQAVVREVAPSVVGIRAQRQFAEAAGSSSDTGRASTGTGQSVLVHGSGTIISPDGEILTNEHVVQNTTRIDVVLSDGSTAQATIAASDPRADLAILKINRTGLRPARFCNWPEVQRGQWTLVLGNPFGLGSDGQLSLSTGVIANLDRSLPGLGEVDDRLYHDMLQTTATINPGNSGGPLFNIRGELIGIVTAMHTRAVLDDGVGFAIPMSPSRREQIDRLRAGRKPDYGYLGLGVRSLDSLERASAGVQDAPGIIVERVEPDGPAARAGVQTGDRLVRLNRVALASPADLAERVGRTPSGETAALELIRGGQPLTLQIPVEPRTLDRVSWMRRGAAEWRGLRLSELTPTVRDRLRVPGDARGVVVIDVLADSPAGRGDFRVGDVIERIAGTEIATLGEFLAQTNPATATVELVVLNRGARRIDP